MWPDVPASVPPTVVVKFAGARDAFLRWTGDAAVASVVPGGVMNVALTGRTTLVVCMVKPNV